MKSAAKPVAAPALPTESAEHAQHAVQAPSEPPGTEPDPVRWDSQMRRTALKLLFNWPVRVWQLCLQFRKSVKDAYGRDRAHVEAAAAVQADGKRRKVCLDADADSSRAHVEPDGQDDAEWTASEGHRMLGALSEMDMSTSFSGIDAPATAFLNLGIGLCKLLDVSLEHIPRPRNLFAVEWTHPCQQELSCHPHQPEHIFDDISEFFVPQINARLDALIAQNKVQSVLVPLVMKGGATTTSAYCLRHKKTCQARGGDGSAGTSLVTSLSGQGVAETLPKP